MEFTPLILAHIATASMALIIGAVAFTLKKGTTRHRILGRMWIGLMVSTALMSFGIRASGNFSAIHILSVLALVGVTAALVAAIRGRINTHRRAMQATYISLSIAGAFALLPGRRLGDLLWNAIGLA